MRVHVRFDLKHRSPTAYAIECEGELLLDFEDAGRSARLGPAAFERFSWRDILRWGAPFALAPQGVVALHGSAVRRAKGPVVAFLGVGGAGKSTLARELGRRGWQPVADDMIVCQDGAAVNLAGEALLRDWSGAYEGRIATGIVVDYAELARRLAAGTSLVAPLATVAFLDPARTAGAAFLARPLSATDYFCQLVNYGFGGLPSPTAWKHQFTAYGALAARTAGAVLAAPAGIRRMRAALDQLEELLGEWPHRHDESHT